MRKQKIYRDRSKYGNRSDWEDSIYENMGVSPVVYPFKKQIGEEVDYDKICFDPFQVYTENTVNVKLDGEIVNCRVENRTFCITKDHYLKLMLFFLKKNPNHTWIRGYIFHNLRVLKSVLDYSTPEVEKILQREPVNNMLFHETFYNF